MAQYAEIINASVVSVIVADITTIGGFPGQWVDITGEPGVGIGWGYAGEVFSAPAALPLPTVFTRLAFRNRFTMAEKQTIYTAAASSVDIRIFLDDLAAASEIDITNLQTAGGVQALEAAGLIATGRSTEILTP
ncbi:MAG: hypothetical protein ACI9DH_000549 [Halioglobus sp.]|jgi:hypothetical protein